MPSPSWLLAALPENWQTAGFGLYIHWPFCAARCPYCDFNSHVSARIDHDRWKRAYVAEIKRIGDRTGDRILSSLYFGGGTPSLMDISLVDAVMDAVRMTWTTANDLEVTLEANPTSAEANRFTGYRESGVNRVSIGVQALVDDDLRALGRLHSAADALNAVAMAGDIFERVSFDLIYGRQHQTVEDWRSELRMALALEPDHLSIYQLTVEPGTAFGERLAHGNLPGLPDEDLSANFFIATQELCDVAGLRAYEISNHARPNAESRHNLIYWRSGDYAGIGPGAHGRLTLGGTRLATATPLSPVTWLERVEDGNTGEWTLNPLTDREADTEALMMGLRIEEGIDLDRLKGLEYFSCNIKMLIREGFLRCSNGRLRATPIGRRVLDSVLSALFEGQV